MVSELKVKKVTRTTVGYKVKALRAGDSLGAVTFRSFAFNINMMLNFQEN
jgi:hypothetical protein